MCLPTWRHAISEPLDQSILLRARFVEGMRSSEAVLLLLPADLQAGSSAKWRTVQLGETFQILDQVECEKRSINVMVGISATPTFSEARERTVAWHSLTTGWRASRDRVAKGSSAPNGSNRQLAV
jgi:hypothetical protein